MENKEIQIRCLKLYDDCSFEENLKIFNFRSEFRMWSVILKNIAFGVNFNGIGIIKKRLNEISNSILSFRWVRLATEVIPV